MPNPAFNIQSAVRPLAQPGQWTTCVVSDARGLFIGTQSNGVWFQSALDKQWWHFTTRDGLGADDITALCIDTRGRLWVGHGRDGLSVGNGKSWRHFPAHSAPFGAHINALACSSTGEIWVAGNENLAVFDAKNQWRTAATPSTLPTSQINVLTANHDGTMFLGTQNDGVWIARDAKQNWQHIAGAITMPDSSSGAGLPGSVINAILCAGQNVWVGTSNGLALSSDGGASWKFRRGEDWQRRLWGLAQIVMPQETLVNGALLRADWVESLGLSASGDLIIGYRNGYEIRTPDAETILEAVVNEQQLVRSVTQNAAASTCIAAFGVGAFQIGALKTPANVVDQGAPLPPAPTMPDAATLNALAAQLEAWPARENDFRACALPDDWTTRGDWLGRYGRYWAVMCALNSPSDYVWGAHAEPQEYRVSGGRMTPGDSMRFYIHELYSADPNALEMPQAYFDSRLKLKQGAAPDQMRRIAEWNDNGHEYPTSSDGPNLYLALDIPDGDFLLSQYDWNKDERQGPNARRDFTLSLRERTPNWVVSDPRGTNYEQFEKWPELARGRIQKFGSGVYKKFLIRGPRRIALQVARNGSHNTLLMGVFLDRAQEKPAPYFPANSSITEDIVLSDVFKNDNKTSDAAARLWRAMQNARAQNAARWTSESAQFCAPLATWMSAHLQKLSAEQRKSAALRAAHLQLATLLYECGEFAAWENQLRAAGEVPARDIEHALTWDGKSNYSGRGYSTLRNYLDGKGSTP